MKTIAKLVLSVLAILVVVGLVGGYLGLIPRVAKVLGTDKPRDLGVKYTKQDYSAYNERAKYKVVQVKELEAGGNSIVFSGESKVNGSFSQEEISARLNYSNWKYMPVSNTQIKINPDGTAEFSAVLRTDRLVGFIKSIGDVNYTPEEVNKAMEMLNNISQNPPIYAKFKAEIKDNKLDLVVDKVEVGRVAVPLDQVGGSDAVKALAQDIMDKTPGLDAQSVTFADGKMNLVGTAPAVATVVIE